MRITGIITCYNYGDLVADAIRSFVSQDYDEKRLVVVDDGSSDNSWDAIGRAADEHSRSPCPIEVFRLDAPHGPSVAKNLAMQQVGDYSDAFAFLDADDLYGPGKLAKSAAVLSDPYGHPGLVYTDYYCHDRVRGPASAHHLCSSWSPEGLRGGHVHLGNAVVSREAIAVAGPFDETMPVAEDLDLAVRISRKFMLVHVAEPLVTIRVTHRALRIRVPLAEWDYHVNNFIKKIIT